MAELKQAWITPSNFAKLMAVKGFGKIAEDYADEVILSMHGIYKPFFTSAPTNWGIEKESEAIERYSIETLQTITPVEYSIQHPSVEYVKGKPDGIVVEAHGIIEVKCPYNPVGHLDCMRTFQKEVIEKPKGYMEDYWWQIQGYLWITDREWCDFVTYDPRFEHEKQILIQRVFNNEKDIAKLSERCEQFWEMVQNRIPKI